MVEEHGGEVPDDDGALIELPGVGRKTANVVLGHALGVPGLPVDRHVLRVANRIGIAAGGRSRGRRAAALRRAAAEATWTQTSDTLILHGRRICKPKPLCDQCAVRDDCVLPRDVRRAALEGRGPKAPGEDTRRHDCVTRDAFERLVEEALSDIPRRFRDEMRNVAIIVEDEPSPEILDEMEIEPPDSLFGLYQGTPLPERELGLRQRAARPDLDLSGTARGRVRGRGVIRDCVAETSSTSSATTSA